MTPKSSEPDVNESKPPELNDNKFPKPISELPSPELTRSPNSELDPVLEVPITSSSQSIARTDPPCYSPTLAGRDGQMSALL
uniref:Uncharacterized protein n=1 Tax=Mycena chlorophos TaxID=658473 RepID=A0ABQ0M8V7_MYCCL|nr:predicted protein [Mycena chlorophos]